MSGEIAKWFVVRDRVPYRIEVDPDPTTTPYERNYKIDDKIAYRAGRWQFVIVTVVVHLPHVAVRAVLAEVEYGDLPGISIDMRHLLDHHPVPDLIAECRQLLVELHTDLTRRLASPTNPVEGGTPQ